MNVLSKKLGIPNEEEENSDFIVCKNREIQIYLSESVIANIWHWWKSNSSRFPTLSCVAQNVLGISATKVTSERLFSLSGNIVTATRSNLLSTHVEELYFLNTNLNYIYFNMFRNIFNLYFACLIL